MIRIIKIDIVNPENNKRILIDCFKISVELKDKKLVKDFFKLSSLQKSFFNRNSFISLKV